MIDSQINNPLTLDKILTARKMIMDNPLSYPITVYTNSKYYRIDHKDAEPVEVFYE